MREAIAPRLHFFVCANHRSGSPLGDGCAERGEAVYEALKREVAERRAYTEVWITKTHCLGLCPKEGCTVARYPKIFTEVTLEDVPTLLEDREDKEDKPFSAELDALEELQRKKVLDLARRLKPGLTSEDVQNPHDFPELDDPDWHYADGVLSGIAGAKSAFAAWAWKKS